MRLRQTLALLLFAAACDGEPLPEEAPIPLPPRDARAPEDGAVSGCDTNDLNHCGRCGNVCPSGPRGHAVCLAGRCSLACDQGWGNCNGSIADGCEADLRARVDACGACGRDCSACGGTTCTEGICDAPALATAPRDVDLLAVAPETVTYSDTRTIDQVTKADGGVAYVLDVPRTPELVVRGNVFVVYPGTESFSGIYDTFPGFVGPPFPAYAQGQNVEAMAVDETGVYYAVEKSNGVSRVLRCKDCSVPTELSPTENTVRPHAIAIDPTTVFFGAGDMIRRVEKTATDLKTIAVGQEPRSLAVDDTHVYWINDAPFGTDLDAGPGQAAVVRVAKAGGTAETIMTGLVRPLFLALAGDQVYVTDRGVGPAGGAVVRAAKDGSERVLLARDVPALGGFGVDGTCAWYAAGPTIRRVAR